MRTVPEILEQLNKTLTIPAAEYVPAIGDAFLLIDEALAAHRAQAGEAAEDAEELQRKREVNQWDHVRDFIPVFNAAMADQWHWYANTDCKYVELRIDMRDGGCIIKNRTGERITPTMLARQFGKPDGSLPSASPHQVAQQGQAGEAVAEVYSISAMRSDEDAYATVRLLHRASDQWGLRVRAGDKLYASLHQVAQPLSVEQITRCWYGTPNGYAPFARAVEAAFCEANDIKLAAPTKEQTNG